MAIAVLLTGLLMPVLSQVHENAHRVMCLSNLQQIGQGMAMYGHEHNDALPYSVALHGEVRPQNLMAAWQAYGDGHWDGLGVLYAGEYCDRPECFYCPSHHGNHPYERYADQWSKPIPTQPIYTNYHYAGDVEWQNNGKRRTLMDGYRVVLATDGLRTMSDFNHDTGMNVLRGDNSVRWHDDNHNILSQLPHNESEPPSISYLSLWDVLQLQR